MTDCNIKKGRNFHEYNGVRYDVDTPYSELAWESLEYNDKKREVIYKIWGYAKNSFPCPMCRRADDVVFLIEPTGVVAKCTLCKIGILVPPMDPEYPQDANKNYAELLHSEKPSMDRAFEIAKRIGAENILPPSVTQTTTRSRFGKSKPEPTQ